MFLHALQRALYIIFYITTLFITRSAYQFISHYLCFSKRERTYFRNVAMLQIFQYTYIKEQYKSENKGVTRTSIA